MANLLFTLAPGRFVTAWVLDLLKKRADLQAKKSPIYPANFDTFYGLLELVPSGISPFLVFF